MPEKVKEAMDLKCDCFICREEKQVITICLDCWRLIRKALAIKGEMIALSILSVSPKNLIYHLPQGKEENESVFLSVYIGNNGERF